ncbi:MCE family protein [Catellatospora chokoriensis]|uniref:ABC transporter substrate-binding protein n=1 Tax=Catellatospora chokoriensis TaxID=310353 RepID=A0A8J3JYZ0_9ACTN|nr:MCE family protein [Catellatospora chokoriensis]GIF89437.1 ABC transporter substrate-binding protein [Catellatospora chokoriensis]
MTQVIRQRLLGAGFVLVLVSALTLSVLVYQRAFTPVEWVTLRTDHVGMQLSEGADVKLRGVVIGDVREIRADGAAATLRLALDPALIGLVPADVTARLLPKTLFGERYVELVPPATPAGQPLRPGAVIDQDRSASAVELEQVLDRALPVLQSIKPDKLAATLGALAYALEGRGDQLGRDLSTANAYLAALNEQMPLIATDVKRLAQVLDVYHGALPDLLALLRDVTVTARTVVDQRAELSRFLADTTDLAGRGRDFLDRHDARIVQVGQVSRPVLELLAAYAPEYPCLLRGLVALQPRVEKVFSTGRMHITLEVGRDNGKYTAGARPVYGADDGPQCRGLPDPKVPAAQHPIDDGYDYGANRSPLPFADMGPAGTAQEQALLKPLLGLAQGAGPEQVPDVAVLLWGPLLRGTVVNAS